MTVADTELVIVPVFDAGEQYGFVYTIGRETELFCLEVPYSSLLEVCSMINFLKDRNVTSAQRCLRPSTGQRYLTVEYPSDLTDGIREAYCTQSTGSRFLELCPYVTFESHRQWVPDPHGVGRDARAPAHPWPRNGYPNEGRVRAGLL